MGQTRILWVVSVLFPELRGCHAHISAGRRALRWEMKIWPSKIFDDFLNNNSITTMIRETNCSLSLQLSQCSQRTPTTCTLEFSEDALYAQRVWCGSQGKCSSIRWFLIRAVQLLSEAITVSRTSGDRVTLQNCVRYVLLATSAALESEIFVTVVCFTDFPRRVQNGD